MICLIQLLFYEVHDGKRTLKCKGKECMWYGGSDCWAAERDRKGRQLRGIERTDDREDTE